MLDVFIKWAQHKKKPVYRVLGDVLGIGNRTGAQILRQYGLEKNMPYARITAELKQTLTKHIQILDPVKQPTSSGLIEHKRRNIEKLVDIRSYRGFRHVSNLPVRGQRTKTNARTRKNFRPKSQLSLRSSYRHKKNNSKDKKNQGKFYIGELSSYTRPNLHRARSRKDF